MSQDWEKEFNKLTLDQKNEYMYHVGMYMDRKGKKPSDEWCMKVITFVKEEKCDHYMIPYHEYSEDRDDGIYIEIEAKCDKCERHFFASETLEMKDFKLMGVDL